MRIDIVNCGIVTGDGKSVLDNTSVIVKDCFIDELPGVRYVPYNAYADRVINARGDLVIPGIINAHAHGVAFGTFQPWALPGLSVERLLFNLNSHLLQGTTTILSTDALCLPWEIEAINKLHPVNVRMAAMHTPAHIRAAELTLGYEVEEKRKKFPLGEAIRLGAIALGEVGSPGTAYGTDEKGRRLNKFISARNSLALDNAVLAGDELKIRKVLTDAGLEEITTAEARKLVEDTSVTPVTACCDAIRDSVNHVKKFGLPVLAHTEPGMKDALLDVAKEIGPNLIAVHVNHSFTPEEMVNVARELKSLGAIVEVISTDSFGARQVEPNPEGTFAILKEGLADMMTTDFCGGYHDPILLFLQQAINEEVITLPRAVQLATSGPARCIPLIAPNRGTIEPGRVADLCIVDREDISKVRYVIIGGRVVVEEGRIII
jgi:imidazolonepropionase-like amidohydrolase